MTFRSIAKPRDQGVTFVELFFDLVFVFSVTQLVELLHHDLSWQAVGQMILIFWLIWWAWTQFAWSLNTADTEEPFVQLAVLLATGVAFFMAVGVPQAFADGALWFAVPYIVVRIIGNLVIYIVSLEHPSFRAGLRTWITLSAVGVGAVLLGAILGGAAQYWLWGLAIVLDVFAADVGGRREDYDWDMRPAHFTERHGLFVIIALGETLILAAGAVTVTLWSGQLLTVALLSVAISGGLWWTYFRRASSAIEDAISTAPASKQASIAVESYSFTHFVMLGGVIAYAAAIEQAITHPGEALPLAESWALAVGVILFVSGMSFAQWRANGKVSMQRVMINIATGAAIVASAGLDASITLSVALVGIVAIAVLEK